MKAIRPKYIPWCFQDGASRHRAILGGSHASLHCKETWWSQRGDGVVLDDMMLLYIFVFCMLLCCYICLIMSLSLILDPQHQILNIEKERGREGFSRQDIATHVYFPWFNHQTFTQRACQQDFVDGDSSTEGTASRDWPRDAGEQAF